MAIARETNGTSSGGVPALSTSVSVSLGSGVSNGDLIVVAIVTTAVEGVTPPAGYTLKVSTGFTGGAINIFIHTWRTGDATSGLSFTFASSSAVWVTAAYVGVNTAITAFPHGSQANALSSTGTSPTIAPITASDMLLMFYGAGLNDTYSAPSVGSINIQANETTLDSVCIADFALTSSGFTGAQTITLSTSVANVGVQMALPPLLAFPTPPAPQISSIIVNFGPKPVLPIGFWDFAPFQAAQPIGYPVTLPPPIAAIIQNFSPRVWPVGFWDSRVVSAAQPVGPSPARAIPIAAILKNWSQWLSPIPTWTPSLFNPANPPAIPSPNAVPIAAILSNFSMRLLRVPAFGTGFNSSFPQAFPTPPAPNIPQILLNFGPRVLALPPRLAYETATIVAPSVGPSPSALPIAAIVQGWTPRRIFPPYSDSWNFSIPPPPIGYPTPPAPNVRQILLNFYPQPPNLIIPFYGSGIFVPIPTPVPGGLHSAFTLIIADSFRYLLLSAGSELTRPLILADDMLFFLESAAPALAVNLQLAATAHNITLVSVG